MKTCITIGIICKGKFILRASYYGYRQSLVFMLSNGDEQSINYNQILPVFLYPIPITKSFNRLSPIPITKSFNRLSLTEQGVKVANI